MVICYFAARHNRLDSMQVLLDLGTGVGHVDHNNKESALHIAARHSNPEMVSLLLKNNARAILKNKRGDTALDIAKQRQVLDPAIVKMLEEREQQEENDVLRAFKSLFQSN